MASSTICSISMPQCLFGNHKSFPLPKSNSLILNHSSKHLPPLSSSPASLVETGEDDDLSFSGCRGCGKEDKESGCNGEGRIQGGIATVPGFGWWPIKAYRPCPAFVQAGGRYRRFGQSMDEVAFGRGGDSKPSTDSQIKAKKEPKS